MTSHSSALEAGLVCLSAVVVVVAMSSWLAAGSATGEGTIGGADCETSCGGVDIPFPFGMGPDHCWMVGFEISCKDTGNGVLKPFMVTINEDTKAKEAVMEVLNISLEQGEAKLLHPISSYCYDAASRKMVANVWHWSLANYSFSSTANKFTVVGCRALAYIGNTRRNVAAMYQYQTGCVSMCFNRKMSLNPCSGNGCCQTAIPKGLQYYQVWFDEGFMNISGIDGGADFFGRCSFAVLMDSSNFPLSTSSSNNISSPELINNINSASQFFNSSRGGKAPVVLDWSIGEDNCSTAVPAPHPPIQSNQTQREQQPVPAGNRSWFWVSLPPTQPSRLASPPKSFHVSPAAGSREAKRRREKMVGLLPETNAAAETDVLLDAWDFKGRPAPRATTGRWGAAAMILVAELNERLTTLGIAVNLVTYLTGTMHLGNAESANVVTNFMGTSFMLCLLGGFVADSFLGRYLTIAIFTAVQASGVTILTISTAAPGLRPSPCSANANNGGECARATGAQLGVMYLALYLTALGTGGLKSSVSGFGSDQFDESDRGEKHQMMRFFNWFFFFISLGSLLAVTVLVYVQDNLGRRWGYGACACAIAAGLVVFLAGTRRYRFKKLAGSPLTQIAAVVVAAWRKRRLPLPADPAMLYDIDVGKAAAVEEGSTKKSKRKERLPHTDQFRFLDHAAINEEPAAEPSKWRLATLTDVEEVKTVVRMLPIWATTIMFWTVYAQMTTFSVSQATTMDRHIGSSFQIPAGSLTVFFVGSILLTVPVYDRIVVPVARRVSGNPHGLTPLQRIGVGLALSVIAMAGAALTEIRRLRVARDAAVPAGGVVPMSVFWLIPQFFLVGAGEAFTYIGQLDFFLRECPKGMKTMSTGLFLSTLSLGFFVSSALVAAVHRVTGDRHPWIADDLNKGRLDNFYWLLAVICLANLFVYLVAARWYKYKAGRPGADGSVNGVEMADEPMLH